MSLYNVDDKGMFSLNALEFFEELNKKLNYLTTIKVLVNEIINDGRIDATLRKNIDDYYSMRKNNLFNFHQSIKELKNIVGVKLNKVIFKGLCFTGVNISNSTLINCSFNETEMAGGRLNGCIFDNCEFQNIEIKTYTKALNESLTIHEKYTDVWQTEFYKCIFKNNKFVNSASSGCTFLHCDFLSCDVTLCSTGCDTKDEPAALIPPFETMPDEINDDEDFIPHWHRYYEKIETSKFISCNFDTTTFDKSNLSYTDFGLSRFTETRFSECKYYFTGFQGCNIDDKTDFEDSIVLPSELKTQISFLKLKNIDDHLRKLYNSNISLKDSILEVRTVTDNIFEELSAKIIPFINRLSIDKNEEINDVINSLKKEKWFNKLNSDIQKVFATGCYLINNIQNLPEGYDLSTAILCFDKSVQMAFNQYQIQDTAIILETIKKYPKNGFKGSEDVSGHLCKGDIYHINSSINIFFFIERITCKYKNNLKTNDSMYRAFYDVSDIRNGFIHRDYYNYENALLPLDNMKNNSLKCLETIASLLKDNC